MTSPRELNADEVEGPQLISDTFSRFFHSGTTKNFLGWFDFFEHVIVMAFLLFGVGVILFNFDIYAEFETKNKLFAVYCVGTPFLFFFLSNLVSKLTFALTGNGDELSNFLMVDDGDILAELNVAQLKHFCREFSSQLLRCKVFSAGFGLFLAFLKVIVDIHRISQHASPSYSMFILALWCCMCLTSVISNGLVYMAATVCKIHATIFRISLTESGNDTSTLLQHHKQLSFLFEKFRNKFYWYFASQVLMCQIAGGLAWNLIYIGHAHGKDIIMLGVTDFLCFLIVEVPLYLSICCVLNDLSAEIEIMGRFILEKRTELWLESSNKVLESMWKAIDVYTARNNNGARLAQLVVGFCGLLPLGCATISMLGKLTGCCSIVFS